MQPETHEALWEIDASLQESLATLKELEAKFFEHRAQVWAALVADGVEQKEIAERSGVDPSDVSRALSTRSL